MLGIRKIIMQAAIRTVRKHLFGMVGVMVAMSIGSAGNVLAKDVGGVNYLESTRAGDTPMTLNGAGVRQQASTALYAIGLYADKRLVTAQEVLAATGPTQLRLVMLRTLSARQLTDMLTQGLVANASDDGSTSLISDVFNVGTMLHERGQLLPGDTIDIESSSTLGITVSIGGNGQRMPAQRTFTNLATYKAMMAIWLGDHPVDTVLKHALLGQAN